MRYIIARLQAELSIEASSKPGLPEREGIAFAVVGPAVAVAAQVRSVVAADEGRKTRGAGRSGADEFVGLHQAAGGGEGFCTLDW
jgi:hypothetical protein